MTRFIKTPALLDRRYQSTYSKGRGDLAKIKLTVEDCGAPRVPVQTTVWYSIPTHTGAVRLHECANNRFTAQILQIRQLLLHQHKQQRVW